MFLHLKLLVLVPAFNVWTILFAGVLSHYQERAFLCIIPDKEEVNMSCMCWF